jgi:nucleotide-binding universal stress UspA family protein
MGQLHFAVASTFSPRFRGVIMEADRVARLFNARLSVLHAGEKTPEKIKTFADIFADMGRKDVEIFWCEGSTSVEALLDAASSEEFDLFIAGTIPRAEDHRNFTGSIVRELFTRTPCDLLLIPDPKEDVHEEISVCLLLEAHSPRWRAAEESLRHLKPAKLSILAADSPFAMAKSRTSEGETLEEIAERLGEVVPEVDLQVVKSNTGFLLCDILQSSEPDFIMVESEWKNRHRVVPIHLGWLEQVIPGRLFLFGKPPRGVKETTTLGLA